MVQFSKEGCMDNLNIHHYQQIPHQIKAILLHYLKTINHFCLGFGREVVSYVQCTNEFFSFLYFFLMMHKNFSIHQ
jgi:hypothetical protein